MGKRKVIGHKQLVAAELLHISRCGKRFWISPSCWPAQQKLNVIHTTSSERFMIISQIPHVIGKCKKINEMVEIPKKKNKKGVISMSWLTPKAFKCGGNSWEWSWKLQQCHVAIFSEFFVGFFGSLESYQATSQAGEVASRYRYR